MIANRLALAVQQALVRASSRPAAVVPGWCVLLAAALLPQQVLAAPEVNLGEQALMARASAGTAPAWAQFNPDLLSGQSKQVDLGAFAEGNPMVAGNYRLDVYVNGEWKGRRDVDFKADAQGRVDACLGLAMLEELGVDSSQLLTPAQDASLPANACVALSERMKDAFGTYDSGNLRYDLSIPQVYLHRQARGYVNPALWDRGINAAFIGYAFNAVDNQSRQPGGARNRNAYLGLNAGLNLGGWQLRHDSNLTWAEGQGRRWQRIATYAQRALPSLGSMLTLGEAHTSGELFDSIGYRGVSLVSDDRMLPDSLRGYAPVVRGIAETNAKVEIRQNGQLIHSITVSPGNFVIDDLYPTGYGGELEVRVVEADGRQRVFKVPYGSVTQMLRAGVSRYALTVGQVREEQVNDTPWMAQGIYQRGMGNHLTLYGGSMLGEDYASVLYGAGVATPIGAVSADVTHARATLLGNDTRQGSSARVSYSNLITQTGTHFTLAAYRYSTRGFFSLNEMLRARAAQANGWNPDLSGRQRSQFQLTVNQALGLRGGALYASGSVRDFHDRPGTSSQYQVGYNNTWRSLSYGLSAVRTEDDLFGTSDTQYLLSVSVPLGLGSRSHSLTADIGTREGRYDNSRIGIAGSLGEDHSLSYGATLTDRRDGGTASAVYAAYSGRYAALSGSYNHASDFRQATLGATGSVLMHAGGITLAPQRGDTMVLVQAPGARDARVTNASGLRVDGRGYALVPYVMPYRLSTITLDPRDMSHEVELQASSQSVAPFAGAISRLRFETRKGRALLIQVRSADGHVLPLGAQVTDAQGNLLGMVGQGGKVYVRSEQDAGALQIAWGTQAQQRCSFDYQTNGHGEAASAGFITLEATCR